MRCEKHNATSTLLTGLPIYSTSTVEQQLQPISYRSIGDCRMVQIENLPFATSFIPTHGARAARAGESMILGGAFARSTYAYFINEDGTLQSVPPNTPRVTPRGILIERGSTNQVTNSSAPSGMTLLAPGEYTVSWYGSGEIVLSGECIALRSEKNSIKRKV